MSLTDRLTSERMQRGIVAPHPQFGNTFIKTFLKDRDVAVYCADENGGESQSIISRAALASCRTVVDEYSLLAGTVKMAMLGMRPKPVWCAEWCEYDSWRYGS